MNEDELRNILLEKFKQKGMSQAKFAAENGIPQTNLSNYFANKKTPLLSNFIEIANALGYEITLRDKKVFLDRYKSGKEACLELLKAGLSEVEVVKQSGIELRTLRTYRAEFRKAGLLDSKKTVVNHFRQNIDTINKLISEGYTTRKILEKIGLEGRIEEFKQFYLFKTNLKKTTKT